jgi:ParB/RepB/Spo0J family partition protein
MEMNGGAQEVAKGGETGSSKTQKRPQYRLQHVLVERIRPEEGLGRKRDREGHRDLCRSIEQFGVLTPITVRKAPDGSGEYLLIKGQGRTLACRLLGIAKIPAIVVDDHFAETEKVQQFLVENVARLKMRPIDRALLIAHARRDGEETAEVAKRFGVSYSTVRRLELQLEGATSGEVLALRANDLNLSLHAVIARNVASKDRAAVIRAIGPSGIRARELEELLAAIGWRELVDLGPKYRAQRLKLLKWSCETLSELPRSQPKERLRQLALQLPLRFPAEARTAKAVNQ